MATTARSIPEVQLKYSEFLWALGKLKYKDYGKKMQERDWFQINPLEVLLLGCKALSRRNSACRDQGTLLLVMEDLTPHMQYKPRFWLHLLNILVRTIKGKEVPSAMKNRCCSALCDLWDLVQCQTEHPCGYRVTCQSWFVNEFYEDIDEILHSSDVAKGDARFEFEKLVLALSTTRESAAKHISEHLSLLQTSNFSPPSAPDHQLHTFGSVILGCYVSEMGKSDVPPHLVHKIFLSDSLLAESPLNKLLFTEGESECSVRCLVATLLKTSQDPAGSLSLLLNLLTVVVSGVSGEWQGPLELLRDELTRSPTPVKTDASQVLSPAPEEQTDQPSTPLVPYDPVEVFSLLLQHLASAIEKWFGLCGEQRNDFGRASLELAQVTLSRADLDTALHECVSFFQEPVSSLMQYAHEGYLSSKPAELLLALLQFACTVVESGTAPSDVLTHYLPNLFGPVFGVRDHEISLQLLLYGEMAINSKHRSMLLGAGLHQIMKVYGLCQPLEIKYAIQKALLERCEAADAAVYATKTLLLQVQKLLFPGITHSADDEPVMSTRPATYQLFSKPEEEQQEEKSSERKIDTNESSVLLAMVEPTKTEVEEDRQLRHKILLGLLQLACAMVKGGDDINFIFRSELPKLLSQPPLQVECQYLEDHDVLRFLPQNGPKVKNTLCWRGDRRVFILELLHLTIAATESGVASPFKLLGIVVPKLSPTPVYLAHSNICSSTQLHFKELTSVHNLDRLGFGDADKLAVATDIFRMTSDALVRGGNIEELISSGLELLSSLISHGSSIEDLKCFMEQMLEQLVHSAHASILFLIRHSVQVFLKHAPEEERELARNVFRKLIFKGRRNEIRSMYRVAQEQLFHPRYTALRGVLYSYAAEGGLTGKQLLAVTELLLSILTLDMEPAKSIVLQETEEEDPEEIERHVQEEQRKETILKLLEPCLNALEKGLTNKFSKDVCETVSSQVSLIALFRTLFWEDIPSLHSLSLQAIEDYFRSKMPPDLLDDSNMMQLLSIAATRLEHMQLPRYKSLKAQLVKVIEHLVGSAVSEGASNEMAMSQRSDSVCQYVNNLPWNQTSYPRLTECGYKESLWTERVSCTVMTDGSLSLQENLRQSLIACFQQYTDILQQLRVSHLTVDGEIVEVQRLFSDELTLSELKGRRALAVKTIDQHLGVAKEGHFQEKKIALLMKEDELESSSEKQAEQPRRPQQFTCTLNISFLDCMKCCAGQIIGCYAPNGEHCERPMEIGVRCDSAFISVYDASGTEVENAELLFCEEGAYLFKSYSSGHPYDTAKVWVTMFARLLKDPLIPAIVVPEGYPNESTWRLLRQSVPAEVTGSILTCQHDISAEWRTYYDYRPERIRCGQDIVLYPQFALTSEGSALPQLLQRQKSRLSKDLAGMMFDHVMQELLTDARMQSFRFMGKFVSMYIARLVQSGQEDASIIQEGFNHKKWKKSVGASSDLVSCSKEEIVHRIQVFVDGHLEEWLQEVDPREFLAEYPKQAIELKTYLEQVPNRTKIQRTKLSDLKALILGRTVTVKLQDLPDLFQVELMHWVFNNEDRVWRYRGGRDRCETLQQYMKFLGREVEQNSESSSAVPQTTTAPKAYPGVVVFFLTGQTIEGSAPIQLDHTFTVRDVIGYAVGETVSGRSAGGRRNSSREGQKVLAVEEGSLVASPVEEVAGRHGDEQEVAHYQPRQSCYEVVTAWVHPNFRQLGLGVRMYFDIAAQVPAHFVMCDMLKGSVERIVRSSFLLRLIDRLRLLTLIVVHKDISYAVDTQVGRTEQFERIVFRVWPVRVALWTHFFFSQCKRLWRSLSSMLSLNGSQS